MNPVEIEEAISALVEQPFDSIDFPFAFLEAFGNRETTIKRLRKGESNKSDLGGVLQTNNIHVGVAAPGEVTKTLVALKTSPATARAKAKFVLATDGETFEAEDLASGETVACAYTDFPNHFGFFLPLAGITTVKQVRDLSYAPCTLDDLRRFGYDYWALGHIHAAEIVSRDPWIVFPGNLQGRSVRETGAKGAVRVTVEDGRIVDVTPLALDGARWAHLTIDVHGAGNEDDVVARTVAALAGARHEAEGRPLAIRVTLTGATLLHNQMHARREALEDDIRARAFQLGDDCWVEQLKVRTTAPPRQGTDLSSAESLDLDQLLDAAAEDPEFAVILTELIETVKAKLPMELHDDLLSDDLHKVLTGEARALLTGALS